MKQFSNNVAIKQSKMLAYRNPSNEDSDNIFRYTLKLNAYLTSGQVDQRWLHEKLFKAKRTKNTGEAAIATSPVCWYILNYREP